MKAKKVYEFKRTRKQGLSTQTELGIIKYTKRQIEKWFQEFTNLNNTIYIINDDLSVHVLDNLVINSKATEIPIPKLKVEGYLELTHSNIEYLPPDLEVRSLYMDKSNLKELPEKLIIHKGLSLYLCKNITKLPDNFKLQEKGFIDISHTNIDELPLSIFYPPGITPNKININTSPPFSESKYTFWGNLDISNTPIKDFASKFKKVAIDGYLDISLTDIKKYPNLLIIYGDFIERHINYEYLPKSLYVMGDIKKI